MAKILFRESISAGVTHGFSVASGDSPVQTEQKGAVAGATGLATGALAPGSNLGGAAVDGLSLGGRPAINWSHRSRWRSR
jgi:hypothetical protein